MFKHIQNFINKGRLVFLDAPKQAPLEQEAAEAMEADNDTLDTQAEVRERSQQLYEQKLKDYRSEHGVDMPADQRQAAATEAANEALKQYKIDQEYKEGMAEFDASMAEAESAQKHEYSDVLGLIDDVMENPYTESEKQGAEKAVNIDERMQHAKEHYEDQGKEAA